MAAKKSRRTAKKSARKGAGGVYVCVTCGKTAKGAYHLCSPVKAKEMYVCAFCGESSGDPRHVCAPMVTEMKYVCKNCGRVTPFRGAVCQPKEIK